MFHSIFIHSRLIFIYRQSFYISCRANFIHSQLLFISVAISNKYRPQIFIPSAAAIARGNFFAMKNAEQKTSRK